MQKERLDILVAERGLAESRSLAQRLIMAGQVLVNGEMNVKPSDKVDTTSDIRLKEPARFVSRGGEKLEAALDAFGLNDLKGWICADIGASTGGFTDCLLQHGAEKVFAIDVGYGQLHWSLRNHPRVEVMERTNARYVQTLPQPVQLVVIDASFISLKVFWPVIKGWFGEGGGQVAALIKPQFEAGRKQTARGEGVIRDAAVHIQVLADVLNQAQEYGYSIPGLIASPILGPKGNREFLMHLTFPGTGASNIEQLISSLHLEGE
jgi:23S rRNA (cytidine1920-2'-O)/16S rRNA (cytidine1409-2'-O)-methyltransferase